MNIELFALCRSFFHNQEGTTINGIFDVINAPGFPLLVPPCAFLARVRITTPDQGKHHFSISMVDEDGNNVIPPYADDEEWVVPPNQSSALANVGCVYQKLIFKKTGEYCITLEIDDIEMGAYPFFVKLTK